MASTLAPYGLRPINRVGGVPMTHGTRAVKIASAYASNLFNGQAGKIHTDGTWIRDGLNSTPAPTGVFVGCGYVDPNLGYQIYKNYWPASTVASTAVAYVVDDPFMLFQVQADGTVAQTALGENVDVSATTNYTGTDGSTTTGNSAMAANATTATTNTFPWRLVDFVTNPGMGSSVGDTYTELVVGWRFGAHSYLTALGV